MEPHGYQQLHGMIDLVGDAVDSLVGSIGEAHEALAAQPYHVLRQVPLVAGPAQQIEQIQEGLTVGIYFAIRIISRGVVNLAHFGLNTYQRYAD